MPKLYPYTDRAMDQFLGNREFEVWDHLKFVPDCIIINLGTNDSSYTKKQPERVDTFGKNYYAFIKQVRKANPTSVILCTLGAMGQDLCEEIERQIELLTEEGEDRVFYMTFDLQNERDNIGADWHPSLITHDKMAKKLEDKIRNIMMW